jgi:hypothetical protein
MVTLRMILPASRVNVKADALIGQARPAVGGQWCSAAASIPAHYRFVHAATAIESVITHDGDTAQCKGHSSASCL